MSKRSSKSPGIVISDLEKSGDISSLPSSVKSFLSTLTVYGVLTLTNNEPFSVLMGKIDAKLKSSKPFFFILGKASPTIYYFDKNIPNAKVKGVIRLTDTTVYRRCESHSILSSSYRYIIEIVGPNQTFFLTPSSELDMNNFLAKIKEVVEIHYPSIAKRRESAGEIPKFQGSESNASLKIGSTSETEASNLGTTPIRSNTPEKIKPTFSEYNVDLVRKASESRGSADLVPVFLDESVSDRVKGDRSSPHTNSQYSSPILNLSGDLYLIPPENDIVSHWQDLFQTAEREILISHFLDKLYQNSNIRSCMQEILEAIYESDKITFAQYKVLFRLFMNLADDFTILFNRYPFYPFISEMDLLRYLENRPPGSYIITITQGEGEPFSNFIVGMNNQNLTTTFRLTVGEKFFGFQEKSTKENYANLLRLTIKYSLNNPINFCYADYPWFFGSISGEQTIEIFNKNWKNRESGIYFLFRFSSSGKGVTLCTSDKNHDTITSYRLSGLEPPIQELGGSHCWNNIEDLLNYFNMKLYIENVSGKTRHIVKRMS